MKQALLRLGAVIALLVGLSGPGTSWGAGADAAKVDELCRAVVEDGNYKVRVQAALVLGKLADPRAVTALVKALGDQNKTVRGIAAAALGQLADRSAADPLRQLLKRETDPFVRSQAEKAIAALAAAGGVGGGGGKKAKIYLMVGPFSGGTKSAAPDAAKIVADSLARELGKLSAVTFTLSPGDQSNFAKSGLLGFYIDGNITRLEDVGAAGASETNCDVKVMIARWPTKSIISWTNAGASVQSGSRPRDKENARRDCLEASAGQLGEELGRFFKSQGG